MKKRILVAPLDWGLGHATRCVPIVRALLARGANVVLASNGGAFDLLHREFPDLSIERLPAYSIRYRRENMFWNMGVQLPHILRTVWREHAALQRLIEQHQIDAVISDSRFGCFSSKVPCVFLTHQLNIHVPNFILKKLVDWVNYQIINRFTVCWIPDVEGEQNLAGKLASSKAKIQTRHIGVLSRMRKLDVPQRFDAIVVLSGPEPQRTYLEQKILVQAKKLTQRFLLVQGKTDRREELQLFENVKVVSFLTSEQLNEAIAESGCVICRSGYSSVMDLAVLGKQAVLIPTPGQTEQEYLAERFFKQGIFYAQPQSALDLRQALQALPGFGGLDANFYEAAKVQLETVIDEFLEVL